MFFVPVRVQMFRQFLIVKIISLCLASGVLAGATPSQCPGIVRPPQVSESVLEKVQKPWIWARGQLSNLKGAYHVFDFFLIHPLKGGMIPSSHPWATGLSPITGNPIWPDNIIYRTPVRPELLQQRTVETDNDIVTRVGKYLASMVERSSSTVERPFGSPSRMPVAVNYLHGSVHYNSGIIIFNNFDEAVSHFSDKNFTKEMQKFAKETGRELMIVFRNQEFNPKNYAETIGVLRSHLPWFANPNGTVRGNADKQEYVYDKKILWGAPSPYPVINPISGNWVEDMKILRDSESDPKKLNDLAKPPVQKEKFFLGAYGSGRTEPTRFEKWVPKFMNGQIKKRKPGQGNLVFTDQRELDREKQLSRERALNLPNLNERYDVVIENSTPEALALAQELGARGLRCLILSSSDKLGGELVAPSENYFFNKKDDQFILPGTPKNILPREKFFPTARYHDYLVDYAKAHDLKVSLGQSIVGVASHESGAVRVSLQNGSEVWASELIQIPKRESSAIQEGPHISIDQYLSPAKLKEQFGNQIRRVLVVSRGKRAWQIVHELENTGFDVHVASVEIDPSTNPEALDSPMLKGRTQMIVEGGRITLVPVPEAINGGVVTFGPWNQKKYDVVLTEVQESNEYVTHPLLSDASSLKDRVHKFADLTQAKVLAKAIPWVGQNSPLDVKDVSQDFSGKRLRLQSPFDPEKDVLLSFAAKCGHTSLFAGGKEFHGRLLVNRVKVYDNSNSVMGGIIVRFPDLSPTQVAQIQKAMDANSGGRTINCFQGACKILETAGIKLKDGSDIYSDPGKAFLAMLSQGFVDSEGQPVRIEMFKANTQDPAEMSDYISKAQRRYSWYLPLWLPKSLSLVIFDRK